MKRLARALMAVALVAGAPLAAAPSEAAATVELERMAVATNVWVAFKVHLPPDAEVTTANITFSGSHTGGRHRGMAWTLRPPYATAVYSHLDGFSSASEVNARIGTGAVPGHGVDVGVGHAQGRREVALVFPYSLRVGDNIIVALIASDHHLTGEVVVTVPNSNGPPPQLLGSAVGPSHYVTEFDLHSDEPYAKVTAGATAAVIRDAHHLAQSSSRFFAWSMIGTFAGLHGDSWRIEGPDPGTECGSMCRMFHGTAPGNYAFHLDQMTSVGLNSAVNIIYADVDLSSLTS